MNGRISDKISAGAAHAADGRRRTFVTLDGMRGVAAISVVLWHLPGPKLLASAYLAVDLFFMLSGFVLAYRYDDKLLDEYQARNFLVMRLIRLYPLYLIGSLIGMAQLLWWTGGHSALLLYGTQGLLAVLALPLLSAHGLVFPLNVPAWSLFYEYLVNILFAFTNRRMGYRGVVSVIGVFGLMMVGLLGIFGHLQFTGQMPKFLFAGIRTLFGFYVGVIIFRLWRDRRLPVWRLHPALIIIAVALLLAAPAERPVGPFFTFGIVFLAFPILLVAGVENEPGGRLARLMTWLGVLSFPLYAVHYPILLLLQHGWAQPPELLRIVISIAVTMTVAWTSLKFWDLPVRRFLTRLHKRALNR